jgi:hypothetical protein
VYQSTTLSSPASVRTKVVSSRVFLSTRVSSLPFV